MPTHDVSPQASTGRAPRRPVARWRWIVGGVLAAALAMAGAQQWSEASYLAGQVRGLAYQRCVQETQDQVDCQRRLPLVGPSYAR